MNRKSTDVNTHLKGRWKLIVAITILVTAFSAFPISAIVKPPRANPRGHPLHMQTVRIGVITPTPSSIGFDFEWPIRFAEETINSHCESLEYDVNFEFIYETIDFNDPIPFYEQHLEKVIMFNDMGINLIIGAITSASAQASLEYIKENDVLLFSPSSSASPLALPGDNLFRLAPTDSYEVNVIANTIWSWGINTVIVFQRDQSWNEAMFNQFKGAFPAPIYGHFRYQVFYPESPDPPEYPDLDEKLSAADLLIGQAFDDPTIENDRVAILFIGYDEVPDIVERVFVLDGGGLSLYPNLQNLKWFGTSGTTFNPDLPGVNDDVDELGFFSPIMVPTPRTNKYEMFVGSYVDEHGTEPGFYEACSFDVAWILANAILKASTTNTESVKSVLRWTANQYFGVTGRCHLNMAGDRDLLDYDVWGLGDVDGGIEWVRYGWYEAYRNDMMWYIEHPGPIHSFPIHRIDLFSEGPIEFRVDEHSYIMHGWVTGPGPLIEEHPYWDEMLGGQQDEFDLTASFELYKEDGGGPFPVPLERYEWFEEIRVEYEIHTVKYVVYYAMFCPGTFDPNSYTFRGEWHLQFTPEGEDPVVIEHTDTVTVIIEDP